MGRFGIQGNERPNRWQPLYIPIGFNKMIIRQITSKFVFIAFFRFEVKIGNKR